MAKETRTVTYPFSMERVGGALERALKETAWNLDELERSEGLNLAGKRGWMGYRTVKVDLSARNGETKVTFQLACKVSEFEAMMAVFDDILANAD